MVAATAGSSPAVLLKQRSYLAGEGAEKMMEFLKNFVVSVPSWEGILSVPCCWRGGG